MPLSNLENFKTIFNAISDGISIIDPDGNHIAVNEAMTKITGFSHEEIYASRPPHCYWPEEELDNISAAFDKTLDGASVDFELLFKKKDGTRFPVSVYPSEIKSDDGDTKYFVATIKDLTEHKKQQQLLNETQFNYQVLLENTTELVCRHTLDGTFLFVSANVQDLLGYSPDELIGKNPYLYHHPDDVERIKRESHEIAMQNDKPPRIIYRFRKKDGTYLWLDTITHPLASSDGEVEQLVTVSRDVTDTKELEFELKRNLSDLKRSNEQLENFAYVASHDLKEPLRMISGFSRLLGKKYADSLDDVANQYIQIIDDGAKRLEILISNLLSYSRTNSKEFVFEPTELSGVIQEALEANRQLLDENDAVVNVGQLPVLNLEPVQIKRVFANLIQNAVKYRSEAKPRIDISSKKFKDHHVISVRDNGVGIQPKDFERVFQIFKRSVPLEDQNGVGIGLAICKKIVEKHQGQIWIEQNEDQGVTFNILIPDKI